MTDKEIKVAERSEDDDRNWFRWAWDNVVAYVYMLWPPHQTEIVAEAMSAGYRNGFQEGVDKGIEGTCKRLAQMNRQRRRHTVREIVKEYGD